MLEEFDTIYLQGVQSRDLKERFSQYAEILEDTVRLSNVVAALKESLLEYGSGAVTSIDVTELRERNKTIELKLQE